MKIDADQQAAIDASSNTVVRAGAGAGKTAVLVQRYVRLVEDGLPVSQILTLTFTRKAAAEMHERIYRELARRAVDGSDHLKEQLRDFDNAVISTLDSFCSAIARSGCRNYGLPPTFTVDDQAVDRFCNDLALKFILGRGDGEGSQAMVSLLRLNRFEPLLREGFARLARDHFLVSRTIDIPEMARSQRRHLTDRLEALAQTISDAAAEISRLDTQAAKCVAGGAELIASIDLSLLADHSIIGAVPPQAALHRLPEDARERVLEQRALLDRLGQLKKNCGSSSKPDVLAYKEHVDAIRSAAADMDDHLLALISWHEVAAAAELAAGFQATVLEQKRRSGILSYRDVVALAISVLTDDPEIRRYYKKRFRAIMIDEFQDNNEEQKELLFLLAEREDRHADGIPSAGDLDPGKLFFVGDEKQSIYRFRGADVSVFKALSDELGGEETQLVLGSNYRSEPGLIRFFNAFFERIFIEPEVEYEARFDSLGSRDPTDGVSASVQLWKLQSPEDRTDFLSNDEAEAYHIARYIRDTVDHGGLIVAGSDDAGARPAEFGDIAILMRASTIQMQLERMLRLFGVPYVAQTAPSLFLEAPLNDMYNLLQLVLYPQDRVALAAFLRSPLVGMGDNGVIRVLLSDGDLFTNVEGLDARDEERYALARERYREMAALADTRPVTEVVHHIWERWGYRNHLLRTPEHRAYLEHYDYIYELAHLYQREGLAAFLAVIRRNRGRSQRLDELNVIRTDEGGVRLMTIHKAKGLEFPVVILANAGNRGRSSRISDAPFYNSREHGLVFNVASSEADGVRNTPLNPIYRAEQEQAKAENQAELRRLLYVGATRAETHLIFSGHPRGDDQSLMAMLDGPFAAAESDLAGATDLSVSTLELEPLPRSALFSVRRPREDAASPKEPGSPEPPAPPVSPTPRSYPRRTFSATELNAAAAGLQAAAGSAPAASSRSGALPAGNLLLVDEDRYRQHADLFGTFAHHCVEQLGRASASAEELLDPRQVSPRLRPDLDDEALRRYLEEGVSVAERFLESETWALATGARLVDFELPFLLRLGDARVRGKMDLVMELEDRVIVVDFKTDRELNPDDYVVQLHLYRMAASAISGKPAEASLHHLRSGRTIAMDEEVATAQLLELIERLRSA